MKNAEGNGFKVPFTQRTSRVGCCVDSCTSTYYNTDASVKFYSFPNRPYEAARKEVWINNIRRFRPTYKKEPWYPKRHHKICSLHFVGNEKSNHPQNPAYHPTIFPELPNDVKNWFVQPRVRNHLHHHVVPHRNLTAQNGANTEEDVPIKKQKIVTVEVAPAQAGPSSSTRWTDIQRHTVRRWIERYQTEGNMSHRPRLAREKNRATTREQDQAIVDFVLNNPITNTTKIKKAIGDLTCGRMTISRRLKATGINYSHPVKKNSISSQQNATVPLANEEASRPTSTLNTSDPESEENSVDSVSMASGDMEESLDPLVFTNPSTESPFWKLDAFIERLQTENLHEKDRSTLCEIIETIVALYNETKTDPLSITDTKEGVESAGNLDVVNDNSKTICVKDQNHLKMENSSLKKQVTQFKHKKLKRKNNKQNAKKPARTVSACIVDSLRENTKQCKFYTGFSFDQIVALFEFLSPANNLSYCGTKNKVYRPPTKVLQPIEELIILLVRLRSGLSLDDIGSQFNISSGLVSKVVNAWILHAYTKFDRNRRDTFTSREVINKNLPDQFEQIKNIRVIIDCVNLFCQEPVDISGNRRRYVKAYKVLLGCTPNGRVSFVSDLFEACTPDREIYKESKLLDFLQEGDGILGERGFGIKCLTDEKNLVLFSPPILKARCSLTVSACPTAVMRSPIENVASRLKQFKLLVKPWPNSMTCYLSHTVFVCAFLLNFQEHVILNDKDCVSIT